MNINLNPNSELNQSIVNVPDVVQVPDVWVNEARQFRMAMMMYACAIREVKTKLEVLNDELSIKNQRNPIEMIKSRVKKPMSILEKLQRRGLEVSVASMTKNLDDVAGIFLGQQKAHTGRGTDPYDRHGFLGKSGSSVKV